jgi:hypothetical protein
MDYGFGNDEVPTTPTPAPGNHSAQVIFDQDNDPVRRVMIVWDVENVRIPKNMDAGDVMGALARTFVRGRRCDGCICGCTFKSLRCMGANQVNAMTNNRHLNAKLLCASGGERKTTGSDHVMIETMQSFAVDCALTSVRGLMVLITGDADFVRPALWCASLGSCSFATMFNSANSSREMRQLAADWTMDWDSFLAWQLGVGSSADARTDMNASTFTLPNFRRRPIHSKSHKIMSTICNRQQQNPGNDGPSEEKNLIDLNDNQNVAVLIDIDDLSTNCFSYSNDDHVNDPFSACCIGEASQAHGENKTQYRLDTLSFLTNAVVVVAIIVLVSVEVRALVVS